MWDVFALAVAVEAAVAFVPAAVALGALRLDRTISLTLAPALTAFFVTALTIVYRVAGVPCSWETIVLPLVGVAAAAALAAVLARRARGLRPAARDAQQRRDARLRACRLALAVVVGVAAGAFVFAGNLESAGSYLQELDNVHHLGQIRAYLETGLWSPFDATMYPGDDARFDASAQGGFYPSVWALFAALAADATGAPVAVAANATTFMFGFVAYPVGMWAFLETVFPDRPATVALGSCAAVAFGAFPYGFITFGPLYPNLVSFALIPGVATAFIALFDAARSRAQRIGCAVAFAIGLVGVALAQPNGAFSLGVLVLFFIAQRCARAGGQWWTRRHAVETKAARRRLLAVKLAFAVGFLVLAALLWIALFFAPPLRSVVTHMWASFNTVPQAILGILGTSFTQFAPSVVLGALIVVGAVWTLVHREYVWLTCSYTFMSGIYFVCAVSNGFVKSLTSGFWYTDAARLAGTLVIIGVPLAAIGLTVVVRAILRAADRVHLRRAGDLAGEQDRRVGRSVLRVRRDARRAPGEALVAGVVAAVFLVLAFFPSIPPSDGRIFSTQMGSVAYSISQQYGPEGPKIYDAEEQAFVERALEVLPEDAVVLNEPNDGSGFAYCADGLNVVYRYLREFDGPTELAAGRTVRLGLADIAEDAEVAEAVRELGAEYLIQLDQGDFERESHYLFTYEPEKWTGIDAVNDDTPGFEVVLAEGDMRLYRIAA